MELEEEVKQSVASCGTAKKSPLSGKQILDKMNDSGLDINFLLSDTVAKNMSAEGREELVKSRTIRFLASDESTDRHGDRLAKDGWLLDNYKNNPVFLKQHNSEEAPLGNGINCEITDKGLEIDVYFHCNSEASKEYHGYYASGIMRAVSVGCRIKKIKQYADEEEKKQDGLGMFGIYSLSQELLELSAVSIPSNTNALTSKSMLDKTVQKLLSSGKYDQMILKSLVDNGAVSTSQLDTIKELVDRLEKAVANITESAQAIPSLEDTQKASLASMKNAFDKLFSKKEENDG